MPLLDGIIGCWSPSVRGSGYLLPDLSGRGNHGVLTNMDAGTDWPGAAVRGSHGLVLDYDGTNDFTDCGSRLNTACNGNVTVSMWVQINKQNTLQYLFANVAASGANCNIGLIFTASNRLGWTQAATSIDATGATITNTQWHHVCVTRAGVANSWTLGVWVDGVATTTSTSVNPTAAASNGAIAFGRAGSFNGVYAQAAIGETALYQRALAAAEVLQVYRQGNGAIGRMLTGQTRRTVYGSGLRFQPAWALRRSQIIGGGLR